MRYVYYGSCVLMLALVLLFRTVWPSVDYALWFIIPYILLGIYDIFFTTHNVLRNYPVFGHIRYMFEFVRPEIQQYFVATNQSGRPFSRETRSVVYQRAKNVLDTLPFGTQHNITDVGYESAYHSMSPKVVAEEDARVIVGGDDCTQPYNASRLNISAMSFGAISKNAVLALNKGAKLGNFAHNTGEGGLSPYHLAGGGDIFFQLGTAYFGCRTHQGNFDANKFVELVSNERVKMVEIKISQGAKPSHGGVLPGVKVNEEIAKIRGIEVGETCISPPAHNEFSTPRELCQFIDKLRKLSNGKPIGFKLCIGVHSEFMGICKAMLETNILPDFITVDGAEGGTGAAPIEYSNNLGTTINEAIVFVHSCLLGVNLRDKIKIIASGKVATGFDMITKIALGADMCNCARPMMFAIGCIQALRCNANTCPTGVTTQNPQRVQAIDVNEKHKHVANFHNATVKSFLDLCGAMGLSSPDLLTPAHINRRMAGQVKRTFVEFCPYLQAGELLGKEIHPDYAADWAKASADHFRT